MFTRGYRRRVRARFERNNLTAVITRPERASRPQRLATSRWVDGRGRTADIGTGEGHRSVRKLIVYAIFFSTFPLETSEIERSDPLFRARRSQSI